MSRRHAAVVLALLAGAALTARAVSPSAEQGAPPPDLIYYNARIVTVDDRFSYAQAVAITGDKFTAVGPNDAEIGRASCRERV